MVRLVDTVIFLVILSIVNGSTVEEDLRVSSDHKKILDQFRNVVLPKLTEEYMKEDIYLIRWLRARNFNIETATELLEDNLKWRKMSKIESALDEDWTDFESRYKTNLEGTDKFGSPIYFIPLTNWDIRKASIAGESEQLRRYIYRGFETMVTKVRKLQSEGKNVTRFHVVVDVGRFSLKQHGCIQCLLLYVNIASAELHYPGTWDKVFILNAPATFEVVLNVLRGVLTPETRDSLQVFGSNKESYASKLFEDIDRSQLPPEVGGTNENI